MVIALTIIQVVFSILLILVVLFQSGKSAGLSGAIGGGSSESFMGKNKAGSLDAKLARATKWLAVLFVLLTFALCFFQ